MEFDLARQRAARFRPRELIAQIRDLLLLATGRPAGLAGVSGPGVERLAASLS